MVLTYYVYSVYNTCTMRTLALIIAVAVLSGCATRDHRDRPWDPKGDQQLFEQIPNWDGEAVRVCGKITTLC